MIAGLKPYPKMKDSGVPWLGDVPEHWEVLPNRAIFAEVRDRGYPEEQMLSVTIRKGVIQQQILLADSSKKDSSNQDKSAYKLVRPGDVAYNKMRAWQGAVGVSDYRGIISPAYVVQRPHKGIHPRYLHYLLRTPAFAKEAERWSYGITSDMWSLRPEHFKMIYGCLPPLTEQAAIVRFLDYMDRRIRRYIRAKQKLIKLLEEQKQAIIHRAVTRGLDPNVRFKPSGVEWLGDVPEHWEVVPFKRRVRFQEGPGIMAADFRSSGVPLLRISCLLSDSDPLEGCNFLDATLVEKKWSHFSVQKNDYILNASTSASSILIRPVHDDWVGSVPYTGLIRLWSSGQLVSMRYVSMLMQSPTLQGQLLLARTGVGIAHFGPSHLKRLWITLPPQHEQTKIADSVDHQTSMLNRSISVARHEIALLREYRTRLIADVVTGKLDVREAAARLPDEADEPEPLDEAETLADADEDATDDLDTPSEEAEA